MEQQHLLRCRHARLAPPLPAALVRRQDAGRLLRRPGDANGQALAYLYSRDNEAEARQAKVLSKDEARRIAINIARLPEPLERRIASDAPGARVSLRMVCTS
jgi:hypothetical protein